MDASIKSDFKAIAAKDGAAIERVIVGVYTELSKSWAHPMSVLDGGAHMGFHTLPLANLPNVRSVIAVEANRKTFAAFSAQLARNPMKSKIELVHAALQGNKDASVVDFTTSSTHPGRSGIKPVMALYDKATLFNEPEAVPAATIDLLFADQNRDCGFIKLDLEGSEFQALQGGAMTLSRNRPPCVFENGPDTPTYNGYAVADFLSYLSSCGLVPTTVFGDEMTAANIKDFWYGWALPKEDAERQRIILRNQIARFLGERKQVSA